MKQIIVSHFGDPHALEMRETAIPKPAADEVIIKVAYIGVGAIDLMMRSGVLKEVNLQPPFTPGIEVSGSIHAVGKSVKRFTSGQLVATMMLPDGGYAEYVRAKAALTVPLPSRDLLVGTASIVNLVTAQLVFSRFAPLTQDDKLVVHGASGGLGTACIQIAQLLQPNVSLLATVHNIKKKPYVTRLGCPDVMTSEAFVRSVSQKHDYSVVIDPIGGNLRKASLGALRPYGKLLVVGNVSDDYESNISSQQLWLEGKTVIGLNLALYASLFGTAVNKAMRSVVEALDGKKLAPPPVKIFEFTQAVDAHRYLENGSSTGRVVLHV